MTAIIEATIPIIATIIGYKTPFIPYAVPLLLVADAKVITEQLIRQTRRGRAIPAMSPTLSPTLSAITAGFEDRLRDSRFDLPPGPRRRRQLSCRFTANSSKGDGRSTGENPVMMVMTLIGNTYNFQNDVKSRQPQHAESDGQSSDGSAGKCDERRFVHAAFTSGVCRRTWPS